MMYREYQPSPGLKPYIRCYWTLEAEILTAASSGRRLLTESLEFTFSLASPVEFTDSDGLTKTLLKTGITGPMLRPMRLRPTGRLELFGICFRPGGGYPFFKTPAGALVDHYADAGELCEAGSGQIAECIHTGCLTTASRIEAMNAYLVSLLKKDRAKDRAVTAAIETIERCQGRIAIDRLARELGMSRRNLDRRFKDRTGVTPKQLCRNLRFKNAYKNMAAMPPAGLADMAIAGGYYDQAHLINEFKHFTGTSPGKYFKTVLDDQDFFTANF